VCVCGCVCVCVCVCKSSPSRSPSTPLPPSPLPPPARLSLAKHGGQYPLSLLVPPQLQFAQIFAHVPKTCLLYLHGNSLTLLCFNLPTLTPYSSLLHSSTFVEAAGRPQGSLPLRNFAIPLGGPGRTLSGLSADTV
jgi:hypothetical protein